AASLCRGNARRLGAAGDHALWLLAVLGSRRKLARTQACHDPRFGAHLGAAAATRRARRLRVLLRGNPGDEHRRGGVRLRRRLPAPCAQRHAGARQRAACAHRWTRIDGLDRNRRQRAPRGRRGHAGHALGRGPLGRRGRGGRRHPELRAFYQAHCARSGPGSSVMAKPKTAYVCAECGASALQWFGTCPSCGAAGTLSETVVEKAASHRYAGAAAAPVALHEIQARELERVPTGVPELDRALGGGLVAGQVVLLGGDPGIGKSTLLLQTLAALSQAVLYVSGEESAEQVALRARRLALEVEGVRLIAETQLERVLAALQASRPRVAVVDSIQTLWSDTLQSAPGSVAQVRECAAQLTRHAKRAGIALFMIGHVTKEG